MLWTKESPNKEIETLRAEGKVGSSLQANLQLSLNPQDHALLASLGADLKFVFITSAIFIEAKTVTTTRASTSNDLKCDRCWHYVANLGINPAYPLLCGRCDSNLHGAGETRLFA